MKDGKQSKLLNAAVMGIMAASAATLIFTSPLKAADTKADDKGMCHGINDCKGKGDCGGKGYSCSGKNECKGKGWLKMSKKDCDEKKGKFEPMKGH